MILKKIKYWGEAAVAYLFYWMFYIMPIDMASFVAGWVVEKVGVHLSASEIAYKNLSRCFPNFSDKEKRKIIRQMWNHFGRVIGEVPHWPRVTSKGFFERVEVSGLTNKLSRSGICISGHFGNFELASKFSKECKLNLHLVYRPANNPFVDALINKERIKSGVKLFKKGLAGVRQIQKVLKDGGMIGMLVDQKMNNGIEVPFLGIQAKTTSLPAKFAVKYNIPMIFVKVLRLKGAYYRLEFSQPVKVEPSDSIIKVTEKINLVLEKWIKENPEQWFWVHKRW